MKSVYIAIVLGLVLLYFVNAAVKVDIFNWEMFIHSCIRFFAGFIVLGISYFYEHKLSLKIAIYLVTVLVLTDDMLDYFRNVDSFSAEFMLHNIYMLTWGSLLGYLTMRHLKRRER